MFYEDKTFFYVRFFYPRATRLPFNGSASLSILFGWRFFLLLPFGFVSGPDAARNRFVLARGPILVLKRVLNCSADGV